MAAAQAAGPYDPLGVHVGTFFLYPGLDASVSTNNNIYAAPTGTSDTIIGLVPYATLKSDWSRNAFNLDARLLGNYYSSHSSENTTSSALTADGRIDVSRGANIFGSFRATDAYEARSSAPQQAVLAKPTEYRDYTGRVGADYAVNRLRFIGSAGFDTFRYKDNQFAGGGIFSEQDRNHTDYNGSLRSEYTLSPATFLFGELDVGTDRYQLKPPAVLFTRDASGYTVLGGVRYDLTHLLVGQVGVGYFNRDYKQAGFSTSSGLALNTNLTWSITPLISITGTANRRANTAGIAGSPAYITTEGGLAAAYEWRRNISLHVAGDYAQDEYVGVVRTDDRTSLNGGGDWMLNRAVSVYGLASYQKQTSSGLVAGRNFDDTILTLGVRLRH
jgi:hypothetical protein